jgi:lantibiotic modifying enzyme
MVLKHRELRSSDFANMPRVNGFPATPEAHIEQLVQGFRNGHMRARAWFSSKQESRRSLSGGINTRFVGRSTRWYFSILRRMRDSRYFEHGSERSIAILDALTLPQLPELDGVVRSEFSALERGDIPVFGYSPYSHQIRDEDGQALGSIFVRTGYRGMFERLTAPESWVTAQEQAIRRSLRSSTPVSRTPLEWARDTLDRALELTEVTSPTARRNAALVGLHNGHAGLAVAFALGHVVFGDRRYLHHACNLLARDEAASQRLGRENDSGAYVGLASVGFAADLVVEMLGDERALDIAYHVGRAISARALHSRSKFDVHTGTAGEIIVLNRLFRRFGEADFFYAALVRGEYLAATADEDGDARYWKSSLNQRPLAGLAHGQSGIALAFRSLEMLGGPKYAAAEQALRWEARQFDTKVGDWLDYRYRGLGLRSAPRAWCNGSAGILMASLVGGGAWNDMLIRALESVRSAELKNLWSLCCGAMGRADVLVSAAMLKGDPQLLSEACEIRDRVVAEPSLSFSTSYPLGGLMQGDPGIAFAFLRIHAAENGRQVPTPLSPW